MTSSKSSKTPSLETTAYPVSLRSDKSKKSRKSLWMIMVSVFAATLILSVIALKFMPSSPTQPDKVKSRSKRSPLVSSSSSFMEGSTGPASLYLMNRYNEMNEESALNEISASDSGHCRKRSLSMCSGQVPFNSTTYPNFIGDENEIEASRSLPYFNYIAKSRCNKRIKQLLCAFLEPECQNGRPVPPCKKFCRIALEGCAEFVPQTLELSAAFDCRRYPDSTDPRVCINLAVGPKCAVDEFQCPDRSCIPRHWVCDGVRDCIFAADEANCNTVGESFLRDNYSNYCHHFGESFTLSLSLDKLGEFDRFEWLPQKPKTYKWNAFGYMSLVQTDTPCYCYWSWISDSGSLILLHLSLVISFFYLPFNPFCSTEAG